MHGFPTSSISPVVFSPDLIWPPERIDRLRELWAEGLSASQIAAHLDGVVTRNAVIGKLNRLGLKSRLRRETEIEDEVLAALLQHAETTPFLGAEKGKVPPTPPPPPPQAKLPPRVAPKKLPAAHSPELTPSTTARTAVTIDQLDEDTCRYPLGRVQDRPPFLYCGATTTAPGKPWCPHHFRVCFPPRSR
jgi:GcrA cell cycle regulator